MIDPLHPGLPGLRRQVRFDPAPGRIQAEVEDDFHNFAVTLVHEDGRIAAVETEALRHPWTSCPAAGGHLASSLTGLLLSDIAATVAPLTHCTHMLDLAIVAAAHAHDKAGGRFDMFVADADADSGTPQRTAELWRDGSCLLLWQIEADLITHGPGQGRHLRQLREWLPNEPAWLDEPARLLRRAVFISGGRRYDYEHVRSAADLTQQRGACFTFQPEQAGSALPMLGSKRDFTLAAARGQAASSVSDQGATNER